jgi:hypothetical protein
VPGGLLPRGGDFGPASRRPRLGAGFSTSLTSLSLASWKSSSGRCRRPGERRCRCPASAAATWAR